MDEKKATKFLRGGLLGTARRCLDLRLRDVAGHAGREFSSIGNVEEARYSLAPDVEKRLVLFYLAEFHRRGVAVVPDESLDLEQLRVELARAIVLHRLAQAVAASEGAGGGSRNLIVGVIRSALADGALRPRFRARMRELLEEYEQAAA